MNMPDYILFVDTETSGMPGHWSVSTKKVEKWPYILQIAWEVYTKTGDKIVSRNFYINTGNIHIDEVSQQLHGITTQFLTENGIKRRKALKLLSRDIDKYKPLIVGHFLELDKRMMEVGFTRAKIKQNFAHLPKFCTMVFSKSLQHPSANPKYMRLNELYRYLFNIELTNHHNALSDAMATKEIFFELINRGLLNDKTILKQQSHSNPLSKLSHIFIVTIAVIFVLLVIAAIVKAFY